MRKLTLILTLCALAAACSPAEPAPEPTPNPGLQGGVLATFVVNDDTFNVWVTNPAAIDQLFALQSGDSLANIPNGRILAGPGAGDHNAPWSWHLDPVDIEMAEMTMELCDGEPSYVEDNVAEFVDVVQRYCPWSARLTALDDRR